MVSCKIECDDGKFWADRAQLSKGPKVNEKKNSSMSSWLEKLLSETRRRFSNLMHLIHCSKMSMYRDYLECVVGPNQPIEKKARFQFSYLTALSGKRDLRAQEKKPVPYRSLRGPVADRVNDRNYKYETLVQNTYGLTPRRITVKQQRDRD